MKFTIITTFIFSAILSIFLFVPFLAQVFEQAFGIAGHTASLEQQFLRLGVLSGIYFFLTLIIVKLREKNYD